MNYPSQPRIVGELQEVNRKGDTHEHADKVITVEVRRDESLHAEGTVSFDIPNFDGKETNLILRVNLPQLVQAIAQATLHA